MIARGYREKVFPSSPGSKVRDTRRGTNHERRPIGGYSLSSIKMIPDAARL